MGRLLVRHLGRTRAAGGKADGVVILSLDPGLRSGIALVRAGVSLFTSEIDVRADWAMRPGLAVMRFQQAIADLLSEHRPALLACEMTNTGAGRTPGASAQIPGALMLAAEAMAELQDIPTARLAVNTVRARLFPGVKFEAGKGKQQVQVMLRAQGFQMANAHQSDALAVGLAAGMAATGRTRNARLPGRGSGRECNPKRSEPS